MSLEDKFKNISPRENAGSMASNRFDFQKNWAICKLIELTQKEEDFVLAFEFYEDIIVLDSSNTPKYIDFYQIKTRNSGKYTLNSLLKKTAGSSILGKLFFNAVNFQEETKSLNLVCNSNYSFTDKTLSEKELVRGLDLEQKDIDNIVEKIEIELNIDWLKDILKLVSFQKTDLTINEHGAITKDLLYSFIEKKFSSEVKYNPTALYRSIFDEVNRKNNVEKKPSNLDEVLKYKAISKNEFERILAVTITEPNKIDKLKENVFFQLNSIGVSISEQYKFKEAWKDVEVELLKINNTYFTRTRALIKSILKEKSELLDNELRVVLDLVYLEINKERNDKHEFMYSEHFFKIIILLEIYG